MNGKSLLILISIMMLMSLVSAYTAPSYLSTNMSLNDGYTAPSYLSTNLSLAPAETGNADVDYVLAVDPAVFRFSNCSPDYENALSNPEGQTSTIAVINATNNGTATGDFNIRLTALPATNWTLFSCNDSSSTPSSDNDCITLTDSYQTIWSAVLSTEVKKVWMYANCSFVSTNPQASVEMEAV